MKIVASKALPSTQELAEIIRKEFAGRYTSRLFGWGSNKTVMVRQSPFAGAQISIRNNEITVQGMPSALISVISMTELAVVLILFIGWVLSAPWKKLEKEIAIFLHQKYH